MQAIKPILRWAGSKQRLLPSLSARCPRVFNKYYEPFAGSAVLFFHLDPRRAMLADVNPDLINFYRVLKRDPDSLHELVSNISVGERAYLRIRKRFAEESDPKLRAGYFWYLNRNCFNGLYRTNRDGYFNVPLGKKLPPMPSIDHARACAKRLRKASLRASDYEKVIGEATDGDFIYVDPPYRRASSRDRGEYGPGAMEDADLHRLMSALQKASDRGALILFSYNADVSAHLPGWRHEIVNGRYLISADPQRRRPISEYTSYNYSLEARL
ncbi:Dam family site-specific DNA-(adenine-N6)-methyltransferase [Lysobacter sp. K5869]|uniref:DNA adenine methylase n=1 Tax=Lysobacter sp. K5869 TaxID=2820808 RepID=UPI001C05F729|nr:Dam family site-specific DNA-(adenine-N6)-methyltransferase [Lysobacter sp. K5869]QWP78115.1 Dam family site-specific DNA-(adenine-N6)-methyltransferase [Lysobacter sp. K5869]